MDNFYREDILDAYKHPVNKGSLDEPSVEVHETNPMCGDEVTLQLEIEDEFIKDAKFDGSACVVSVVSSEYLLNKLKGLSIEEASKISKDDLLEMLSLNLTTSRVKCATLVLTALKQALADYERNK